VQVSLHPALHAWRSPRVPLHQFLQGCWSPPRTFWLRVGTIALDRHSIRSVFEQIREPLVRVCGTSPIQLALHVEDEPSIHRAGHKSTSCLHAISTAFLRHVDGFPVPGLLRRLRPPFSRSSVASIIPTQSGWEAGVGFSGSVSSLSSVVGADSTPCGIWSLGLAGFPKDWRPKWFGRLRFASLKREPALRRSFDRLTHFRVGEVTLNGASAIGSVALTMTDMLAGPGDGSEVPSCPALTGSADLWRAGSTRLASPICLRLRAAPLRARGLAPRKVTNSLIMKDLLSSSIT
jgi:hypothetical protein